jgi:hypothetical protein
MKYALLAYDLDRSLDELPTPDKRALHAGHAAMHTAQSTNRDTTLNSHYRFRSPEQAITVRFDGGDAVRRNGPASSTSAALRALYIVESEDLDAVVAAAAELPAVSAGATVEIWPLTEPSAHRTSR